MRVCLSDLRRGKFFKFDVVSADGEVQTPHGIRCCLERIVDMAGGKGGGVVDLLYGSSWLVVNVSLSLTPPPPPPLPPSLPPSLPLEENDERGVPSFTALPRAKWAKVRLHLSLPSLLLSLTFYLSSWVHFNRSISS